MTKQNNAQVQISNGRRQESTGNPWDRIAAGFDEFLTPPNMELGKGALEIAGLEAGMRFLDVGAGCGALSIPAARLGADVLAVDLSSGMVGRLRTRVEQESLPNLEARVMDAYSLELEEGTFDMTGSQNGVSILPDMSRGLQEMVRVTKAGGRVLIVAIGPFDSAEFLTFFVRGIQAAIPGFDSPFADSPPLPFQAADPENLHQRMADAGLTDIRVEQLGWKFKLRSGEDLWAVVTHSNPIGGQIVSSLGDEQKASVLQKLDELLAERSGDHGPAVLTNIVNVGVGTRRKG